MQEGNRNYFVEIVLDKLDVKAVSARTRQPVGNQGNCIKIEPVCFRFSQLKLPRGLALLNNGMILRVLWNRHLAWNGNFAWNKHLAWNIYFQFNRYFI
ncbi:hypothetical protein [Moorena producens]|uniref:hypothetical protein n=1 Tax=Moorena producens TaxID=1155739 RepID=UPI003C76532C